MSWRCDTAHSLTHKKNCAYCKQYTVHSTRSAEHDWFKQSISFHLISAIKIELQAWADTRENTVYGFSFRCVTYHIFYTYTTLQKELSFSLSKSVQKDVFAAQRNFQEIEQLPRRCSNFYVQNPLISEWAGLALLYSTFPELTEHDIHSINKTQKCLAHRLIFCWLSTVYSYLFLLAEVKYFHATTWTRIRSQNQNQTISRIPAMPDTRVLASNRKQHSIVKLIKKSNCLLDQNNIPWTSYSISSTFSIPIVRI